MARTKRRPFSGKDAVTGSAGLASLTSFRPQLPVRVHHVGSAIWLAKRPLHSGWLAMMWFAIFGQLRARIRLVRSALARLACWDLLLVRAPAVILAAMVAVMTAATAT